MPESNKSTVTHGITLGFEQRRQYTVRLGVVYLCEETNKSRKNSYTDMVFSDNHRIVHGRIAFDDYDDENLKRLMLRTWIKDKMYEKN